MGSTKKIALLGFALMFICSWAVAVQADLIVDTGPDDGGVYTGGSVLSKDQWLAGQFYLPQDFTITQVQGLIGYNRSGDIQAVIRADGSGLPVEEWYSQTFTSSNPNYNTWQGPSGLSWTLPAGTYWLAFEVDASSTFDGAMKSIAKAPLDHYACANLPGLPPGEFTYLDYFETGLELGFRVYGESSAVPLPGALLLLGAGLIRLAVYRRRKLLQ
jgi:hypothetical protein